MDDVPAYDTSKPLFIFDGVCVLCSGGVRWIMARDKAGKFNFCSAQSRLGQALYTRHGLNFDETYLIVDRGRAYTKSDGYLYMCSVLGVKVQAAHLVIEIFRAQAHRPCAKTTHVIGDGAAAMRHDQLERGKAREHIR